MTYRSDIDGLRALAVFLVLLFHCQIPGFAGGYIGVDVFFVISGFLITGIMLEDMKKERFNFKRFYIRRARRLLPALAATIVLTLIGSVFLMTPKHLAETASSAIFAALSLANVHFAMADSYFGAASEIKPLLHTWSLSVEEQFYLGWPVLLVLLYRLGGAKAVLIGLLVGTVGGLALSEWWVERNPKQAFFLPMFRAYQFFAGGLLVWVVNRRLPVAIEEVGLLLGVGLVIGSALIYDASSPFPGIAALPPTVGAMLMLMCGRAAISGRVLTLPAVTWLGQVSYSVYLAHWPVIVFWRYLTPGEFALWEKLVLLGLSVVLGVVLYRSVEAPFRLHREAAKRMTWRHLLQPVGVLLGLAGVAAAIQLSGGLPQRMAFAPEQADYAAMSRFHFLEDYEDGTLSLGSGRSGEHILIFGDSMMQNYVPALMSLSRFAEAQVTVITRGGCLMALNAVRASNNSPDRNCMAFRDAVYEQTGPFDLVLWGQNWSGYGPTLHWSDGKDGFTPAFEDKTASFSGWSDGIAASLDALAEAADQIVIFGPQYHAAHVPPILERIGPFAPLERIEDSLSEITAEGSPNRQEFLDGIAGIVAARPGVQMIDPRQLICSDNGTCRFSEEIYSAYMDRTHHTVAITPHLAERFRMLLR